MEEGRPEEGLTKADVDRQEDSGNIQPDDSPYQQSSDDHVLQPDTHDREYQVWFVPHTQTTQTLDTGTSSVKSD